MSSEEPSLHDGPFDEAKIKAECVDLANNLIRLRSLSHPEVKCLADIKSDFFVRLFENVFDVKVPDLKTPPSNSEEEALNVQALINTLSMDVLSVNLSHISGEDVVAGNPRVVKNLLEVFCVYVCYLSDEVKEAEEKALAKKKELKEIERRSCALCGFDPLEKKTEIELCETEALPLDDWTCPVCLFENTKWDSKKSSDLEHTQSSPHSQASAESVSTTPVFETDKSKSEPSDVDIYASKDLRKITIKDVSRKSMGLFAPTVEAPDTMPSSYVFRPDYERPQRKESLKSVASKSEVPIHSHSEELPYSVESQEAQNAGVSRRKSKSINEALPDEAQYIAEPSSSGTTEDDRSSLGSITRKITRLKRKKCDPPSPYADEDDIVSLYEQNMVKRIASFLNKTHYKSHVSQIKKNYQQSIKPNKRRLFLPYRSKFHSTPSSARRRPAHSTPKRVCSRKPQSSPWRGVGKVMPEEKNLIKELMEEFPGIRLSPTTVKQMSDKYEKHLFTMRKKLKDTLSEKSQIQVQREEACKRQKILSNIFNKDLKLSKRMNELDEMKTLERQVKANERESKMESIRMKHYYDEFHTDMIRKLQKKNDGEEQIVKSLFNDALNMQKDQVISLRKQLKEREEKDGKSHQIYLDALENFYQNQFSMLAESLAVERHDAEMRAKAQQRALEAMKREHRSRLVKEIREMQENILRGSEDIHFREMDAERFREVLRDRFSVKF